MKKLLPLCWLILFFGNMQAQVTAHFTVNDSTGCAGFLEIQFTDQSTPTPDIVSWLWDFGDGQTSQVQHPSHTYNDVGLNEVCLTVSNSLGEMDTYCKSNFITLYNIPTANAATGEVCSSTNVGVFDLTTLDPIITSGSGNFVNWYSDIAGLNTIPVVTNFSTTSTTVYAEVFNGFCISPLVAIPLVVNTITADGSATQLVHTLNCLNPTVGPFTLDGSNSSTGSNLTYEWFDVNNILVGDSIVEVVNTAGLYTLVVTDTVAQCSNSDALTITIVQDTAVPITTISPMNPILNCVNTAVILDGSGSSSGGGNPVSFEWLDPNGISIGVNDSVEVSVPGVYTFIVTDTGNGCSSSSQVFVSQDNLPPIAEAGPDMVLTCTTASVTLDGSGSSTGAAIDYSWTGTSIVSNAHTLFPEVVEPGVYYLEVTNIQNGCSAIDSMIVTIDIPIPTYILSPSTIVCQNDLVQIEPCINCSIEVTDLQGVDQCQAIFPCMIDPSNGPFIITVTDNITGCQLVDTLSIVSPDPIEFASVIISDASCNGQIDGAIDIEVIGGSAPYIYSWSNGVPAEDIQNLNPGTYTVTITDANGCELIEDFLVNEPSVIEITNAIITNATCNVGNDGAIEIMVTGGTPGYTYDWSNAWTQPNTTGLIPGIYFVTITDTNGCTTTSPAYEIIENICVDINFPNDTTICVGDFVQAEIIVNAPPPFTVQWTPTVGINDPNILNPTFSPTSTTDYFLTVLDDNGITIFNGGPYTINVQSYLDFGLLDFSNAPLCDGDTLELYANLGTTFEWAGPNGFSTNVENPIINNVTEMESGIYSLTITDNFGCSAMADIDVFIDDDCVWPGDTDTNMVVNHFDLLNIGLAFDSTGTIRENASFFWEAQPSMDWSQSTPTTGVNFKHADTDGNGIINSLDTNAITLNFGQVHNFSSSDNINQFTDLPSGTDGTLMTPFYVEPDTLIEGQTIGLDIILGDVSNVVTGLYGIGFSIEYDSSVVVPGTAKIDFSNTWLGDINADAISIQFDFHSPGRIDAAITRIDGIEMDGFGIFGEFIITLEDDILLWDPNNPNFTGGSNLAVDFTISNYRLINFSQEEILVEGMTTTAPVESPTGLSEIELNNLIEVYPNPTDDKFFIASQNLKIEAVKIFNATGERKLFLEKTNSILEFSTDGFPSGIYFIEIMTEEGRIVKKLSVL